MTNALNHRRNLKALDGCGHDVAGRIWVAEMEGGNEMEGREKGMVEEGRREGERGGRERGEERERERERGGGRVGVGS